MQRRTAIRDGWSLDEFSERPSIVARRRWYRFQIRPLRGTLSTVLSADVLRESLPLAAITRASTAPGGEMVSCTFVLSSIL